MPSSLEPIAIIGMGCRLPGGITSPARFWEFLLAGRDASGQPVPPSRWEPYLAKGPEYARAVRRAIQYGGYLDDVEGFDAEFFGISPREAELIDPQQRITLEVAWEALEHAGVRPDSLAGTDASVFMGVCTDDYGRRLLEDLPRLEAWMGIGSSMCAVANRVSYALDLRGPSVVVDTACSASLVAVHQACQSLRLGETPVAIAGGVMLVTSPSFALVLDAAGALSPDGKSKAFDASADGYGRSEGCAVLVLKRLSDAVSDGDRVLAVVRGSAVCQDGRTNGIMAPSQPGQEHLVRQAARSAGIDPSTVDYVEAHGTGTGVGDPIEVRALANVVGAGRPPGEPCLIGSVKTNVGHLEAASGVAGMIKSVLALKHGELPASLVATELTQDVDWAGSGLRVVTENTPWTTVPGRPRRAGVGNYGYGGTLAHVIIEEAPSTSDSIGTPRAAGPVARLYPLSGASDAGVRANATNLANWLRDGNGAVPLGDVAHTLAHRRTALPVRACVIARDSVELIARLDQFGSGAATAGVSTGEVVRNGASADPVWVFSGHGSQWVGMGRELIGTEPAFAEALDELAPVYREEMGFDPRDALRDDSLDEVGRVQAMIFAVQVGLSAVWRGYGVRPAAVIGHSVGEIAAAVAAGMLELPDAARLICRRSTLLRRVAGKGAMAMVNLPFDEACDRLADRTDVVAAIAASPNSTVLSGSIPAMEDVTARWQADGVNVRKVNSDVAFHGPDMDGLTEDLIGAVAGISSRPPAVPVYGTTLPDPRAYAPRDGEYWAANLRNPVRFAGAVAAAIADGHRLFLEVSAHPVVAHSVVETLEVSGVDGVVVPTLRRDWSERDTLLYHLGRLHCSGVPVDWSVLAPAGELADLPTMAWQHRRYWVDAVTPNAGGGQHDVDSHTVLGPHVAVQGGSAVSLWQTRLDDATRPYPGGHAVLGTEVLPAAVVLTTFLTAAGFDGLADVQLRAPVAVTAPRDLQVVRQDGGLRLSTRLASQQHDASWLTHSAARITDAAAEGGGRLDLAGLTAACGELLDPGEAMRILDAIGVVGIGFPWRVEELRRGERALLARINADPSGELSVNSWGSLLDAALSVAPVLFPGDPLLRMPGALRETVVYAEPPRVALVGVRLVDVDETGEQVEVDIEVATLDGAVLCRMPGVHFGAVQREVIAEFGPDAEAGADEREWVGLAGPELRDHLVGVVCEVVANELRMPADDLGVHRPLVDLGVDSLLSAAIRDRLQRRLRLPLPSTLLWDWPTAAAVGEYLVGLLSEPEELAG